ncbi:hypothetical protein Cha6605_5915 [Chamaesiphon minutus PCC 6605]|uniref:Uncharacterized protein n=1 Tax=Chamaesiphon minutus (strain ATCC 27169 / PCC 6605) TaxID=1173020 RepID=K9UNV5_CHAP6|nr:hypothetical protein Cha6605_5915 [Chamaesiphon minutus PCC 6605]
MNDRLKMAMKKVAAFGNTGGGKSTLSKNLAEITGLPLYILDTNASSQVNFSRQRVSQKIVRC